jgi:hypothetical protein
VKRQRLERDTLLLTRQEICGQLTLDESIAAVE